MKLKALAAVFALAIATTAVPARAAFIMDVVEVGSDIVITGSGTIDLTLWSFDCPFCHIGAGGAIGTLSGGNDIIAVSVGAGPNGTPLDGYVLDSPKLSGPTSAGPLLNPTAGTSGSGDIIIWNFDGFFADGLLGSTEQGMLLLPDGYSSGASLFGSATIAGASLASLGVTPGSFVWSWGSGSTADSITLNIVPEPSTALLICTGLLGLAWSGRHRNAA
ncbi:MAG: PEP-CTERM sorting domain-containing protein [Myxococcota bacterium]|nr:PEP-CTERM sorting domain-containing protein [Myxococcota bacterium]